eukprot:812178-Rhodomonas_salina.1
MQVAAGARASSTAGVSHKVIAKSIAPRQRVVAKRVDDGESFSYQRDLMLTRNDSRLSYKSTQNGPDGMVQSVCGGYPQGGPRWCSVQIAGCNACSAIVSLSLSLVTDDMTTYKTLADRQTADTQTHRHTDRDTQTHTDTQTQEDSSDTQALHHQDWLLHSAAVRARKPTEIWADASRSHYTVGGVLLQGHRLGFQRVAYMSKVMNTAESHYATFEQELLALLKAQMD